METESVEEAAGNVIESTKQITNIFTKYESEIEAKYSFTSDELDTAVKVESCSEGISVKSELVEFDKNDAADELYAKDTGTIILEKIQKTETEILVGDVDPDFCYDEEDYTHSNDEFSDGDSISDPEPPERDPFADVYCDPIFTQPLQSNTFSDSASQNELINPAEADVNDDISNSSSSTSSTANNLRNNRPLKTRDSKLQCQLCRETYNATKELQIHMEKCFASHKDSRSFCVVCNKLFCRPQKYREHAYRIHGVGVKSVKPKPFKCKVCLRSFEHEESFIAHSELHKQSIAVIDTFKLKPFKCQEPDCSSSFNCLSGLTRHKISHGADSAFKCSVPNCDKEFKLAYYLQLHMQRIHSIQERPFKCFEPNCGKTFTTNGILQKHKICHSNARPFKCTDFNCEKTFPSNDRLLIHMARSHNKSGQLEKAEVKPFKCEVCDRAFCKNWLLTSHLKTHRMVENVNISTCPEPKCGKTFKHKESMKKHFTIFHSNKEPTWFECPEPNCGKKSRYKRNLKFHISNVHSNVLAFQCTEPNCDKKFKYKESFQNHLGIHQGVRAFRCTEPSCFATFASKAYLGSHLRNTHRISTRAGLTTN